MSPREGGEGRGDEVGVWGLQHVHSFIPKELRLFNVQTEGGEQKVILTAE